MAEWLEQSARKNAAGKPLIEITKIGDSDPIPFPKGDRPLSRNQGARPHAQPRRADCCAATLAENGADVLMGTAQHLPQAARACDGYEPRQAQLLP
jgi:hypothetical protein